MSKTKTLVRKRIWFPDIKQRVEEAIKHCMPCELCGQSDSPEPIKSTELPFGPWRSLSEDFYGPLQNKHELLVVIDNYSRFPVVTEVASTAAKHVVPALDMTFALLGIPDELTTDNGPPFNGHKIGEFAAHLGFRHRKVTPSHPLTNGLAENFMRGLVK